VNVGFLKAPPRQMSNAAKSIGSSLGKWCFSVHKAHYSSLTKAALPSFATSSKGLHQEESNLPRVHTSDGLDPNVYKLMEKSIYDFSKPPPLGHVVEAKPYRFNDMQKNDTKIG